MKVSSVLKGAVPILALGLLAYAMFSGPATDPDADKPEPGSVTSDDAPMSEFAHDRFANAYDRIITESGLSVMVPDSLPANFTLLESKHFTTGSFLLYGRANALDQPSDLGAGTARLIVGPQPAPDSPESYFKGAFSGPASQKPTTFDALGSIGQSVISGSQRMYITLAKLDTKDMYVRAIGREVPQDQIIEMIQSLRLWESDAIPGTPDPSGIEGSDPFAASVQAARDSGFPLLVPDYLPIGWWSDFGGGNGGGDGARFNGTSHIDMAFIRHTNDAWGDPHPRSSKATVFINQLDPEHLELVSYDDKQNDFQSAEGGPFETVQVGETDAAMTTLGNLSVLNFRHPVSDMDIVINSKNVAAEELIKIAESLRSY